MTATQAKHAACINHRCGGGAARGKTNGGDIACAVVVNATVIVAVCVPSSVTDDGETVHVAAVGAPVQPHVTV